MPTYAPRRYHFCELPPAQLICAPTQAKDPFTHSIHTLRTVLMEDSQCSSPLYSLHSTSSYKFSHDVGGITTPGVWETKGDDGYILLPTRPTPPLIGCGDAPVRGFDAPPPHNVDISTLHDLGYAYRDTPTPTLAALQEEAKKATDGLNIFNVDVSADRPADPKDRRATYAHLPGIPKAYTKRISDGHCGDFPALAALAQTRLEQVATTPTPPPHPPQPLPTTTSTSDTRTHTCINPDTSHLPPLLDSSREPRHRAVPPLCRLHRP
jgi:hypothetical protein